MISPFDTSLEQKIREEYSLLEKDNPEEAKKINKDLSIFSQGGREDIFLFRMAQSPETRQKSAETTLSVLFSDSIQLPVTIRQAGAVFTLLMSADWNASQSAYNSIYQYLGHKLAIHFERGVCPSVLLMILESFSDRPYFPAKAKAIIDGLLSVDGPKKEYHNRLMYAYSALCLNFITPAMPQKNYSLNEVRIKLPSIEMPIEIRESLSSIINKLNPVILED